MGPRFPEENTMNITIVEDGNTLDLTNHPGIIIIHRWGWTLIWDRGGMIRRVPRAILADAVRLMRNRLNAPARHRNKGEPITISWQTVNPRAYEQLGRSRRLPAHHLRMQDLLPPTPFD